MELTINNRMNFCEKFLTPISRISDLTVLTITPQGLTSINRGVDTTIALYAKCRGIAYDSLDFTTLNISDVKKFIRVFDTIPENEITLKVNSNNVEYKSSKTKFKFHLLEDGFIAPVGVSIAKIESFKYDMEFKINTNTLNAILKSSSFVDSEKFYIYTEDGNVMCELTDKSKPYTDSFSTQLSNEFSGTPLTAPLIQPLPYGIDLIRNISTIRGCEIHMKIDTVNRFLCVDIVDNETELRYIAASKGV